MPGVRGRGLWQKMPSRRFCSKGLDRRMARPFCSPEMESYSGSQKGPLSWSSPLWEMRNVTNPCASKKSTAC